MSDRIPLLGSCDGRVMIIGSDSKIWLHGPGEHEWTQLLPEADEPTIIERKEE